MEFVGNLLLSSFPNLTKAQVAGFVSGLLSSDTDLNTFKLHLRDFLVTLKVRSYCRRDVSGEIRCWWMPYLAVVFFFFCNVAA